VVHTKELIMQAVSSDVQSLFPAARPRPLARIRQKHPVATCTRCAAFSFFTSDIKRACRRVRNGAPCPGVLLGTPASTAWRACDGCHGTGWQLGMVCMHCQSLGWRYARHG
jgi:hypothetical protein